MGPTIEFYFDFISPYGYLGSLAIEEMAARHSCDVDWRPMLLGVSVMKVMGLPPIADTPLKGPYFANDFPRCFRRMGVRCEPAGGGALAPLPSGRAFTFLKDTHPDRAAEFARAVYRSHWSEGRSVNTPEALSAVAEELGLDGAAVARACDDDDVKRRHREFVDASVELGVFGSPTFRVGDELFWGHDRVPHVEDWVTRGGF